MAWYDEAVFYHIYPLGLTGAPARNPYTAPVRRLDTLGPWIDHIRDLGCNALYIGPLFESVGHGYETTDYLRLDSRLGTNEDLKAFVTRCHDRGIRVVLDGVFNHVGRDFFAFRDLLEKREGSSYVNWFHRVDFWGNNRFGDGLRYDNWGGDDALVKLDQKNPAVQHYIGDVIRTWVREFDIDGIRLDAADVLDHGFMRYLRQVANEVKPEFWLMGEVIHGNYTMWVNDWTLHSVTGYQLHKALYSGHNDHNYFEIAHTVKRMEDAGLRLYNFVDNHDVERIHTRLRDKAHFGPVHILLYTLPGIPSIYYGSEFGIEGRKMPGSDGSLRPALTLSGLPRDHRVELIRALGKIRRETKVLSYGDYRELVLSTTHYAFSRACGQWEALVAVNNDHNAVTLRLPVKRDGVYIGALSGKRSTASGGILTVTVAGCWGEIWLPEDMQGKDIQPVARPTRQERPQVAAQAKVAVPDKPYEHMTIPELQQAILDKMAKNGPVTDRMRQDVMENHWRNSLLTWVRSFQ